LVFADEVTKVGGWRRTDLRPDYSQQPAARRNHLVFDARSGVAIDVSQNYFGTE
jgi:hypothetical protein